MFRTVFITAGGKLTVNNGWLLVQKGDDTNKIPIDDIQTLVVDDPRTVISVNVLVTLADHEVNVVLCNNKHLPCCNIFPQNTYYSPYGALKRQLDMSENFKGRLWQAIVKSKILNQSYILRRIGTSEKVCTRLQALANEVVEHDKGNREAIAAKMFFRNMYGVDFLRFDDDIVNKALNYGYAIIRSVVARSLCAHGYICSWGIHHINEGNAFNLADDFMEPLRPTVDYWVWEHNEELIDELTTANKSGLVSLTNSFVLQDGKNLKLFNAVEKYISSFTGVINDNDISKFSIPSLMKYGQQIYENNSNV